MRAAIRPRLHLFVCANRREDSPLGPGCSHFGDAVYDTLKDAVGTSGRVADVWVTKTHCLGICPKRGATIARYPAPPGESPILTDVTPEDTPRLLAPTTIEPTLDDVIREIDAIEALQKDKVLDLARRLRPGLTLEDVQNPHDFPELADPDWHYADGILTGIASVRSALAALRAARRSG